jgi:hypothetical protein
VDSKLREGVLDPSAAGDAELCAVIAVPEVVAGAATAVAPGAAAAEEAGLATLGAGDAV